MVSCRLILLCSRHLQSGKFSAHWRLNRQEISNETKYTYLAFYFSDFFKDTHDEKREIQEKTRRFHLNCTWEISSNEPKTWSRWPTFFELSPFSTFPELRGPWELAEHKISEKVSRKVFMGRAIQNFLFDNYSSTFNVRLLQNFPIHVTFFPVLIWGLLGIIAALWMLWLQQKWFPR